MFTVKGDDEQFEIKFSTNNSNQLMFGGVDHNIIISCVCNPIIIIICIIPTIIIRAYGLVNAKW